MEELWKLTIKLNECYRASGVKIKANKVCQKYQDDLKAFINSKEIEPENSLKSTWINYHSN
jgi:hypothetical protein